MNWAIQYAAASTVNSSGYGMEFLSFRNWSAAASATPVYADQTAIGAGYKTEANQCGQLQAQLATPRMANLIRIAIALQPGRRDPTGAPYQRAPART